MKKKYVPVTITMECEIREENHLDVFDNIAENYPDFFLEEAECQSLKKGSFQYIWKGKIEECKKDDFLRLTHHAEGLYEGTGAEYVHVEVSFGQ
jgi:hypothetical protein